MSTYAIVLRKSTRVIVKRQLEESAKTVGKDSGGKSGGLHCIYRQKANRVKLGSL